MMYLILLFQTSIEGAFALCRDFDISIWSTPETGFRMALSLIDRMERLQ